MIARNSGPAATVVTCSRGSGERRIPTHAPWGREKISDWDSPFSRTVTNLSGDGGSGKTLIVMQLIASSSLRTQWLGKDVSTGPCLYYGTEDEADELHRRLKAIVQSAGKQLSELEGIRLIPMAGSDAVLAEPDRTGNLTATALFAKLEAQAKSLRPKLIVIDPKLAPTYSVAVKSTGPRYGNSYRCFAASRSTMIARSCS
jgi:hypothetical protein